MNSLPKRSLRTLSVTWWLILLIFLSLNSRLTNAEDVSPLFEDTHSDSVWLDADTQTILPVELPTQEIQSSNRNSRWLPAAKRVKSPAKASSNNATGGGSSLWSSGNFLGWTMLFLLLVAIIGVLMYAISKAEIDDYSSSTKRSGRQNDGDVDEISMERMKHLPQELRRTDVNLREEAERLMRSGLFDQAVILLFGHQLLLLDHERILRLSRGKTNRRYVRECRSNEAPTAEHLQQTVEAFERSYFGRHEIKAGEFSQLWQNNLDLEAQIKKSKEVAA